MSESRPEPRATTVSPNGSGAPDFKIYQEVCATLAAANIDISEMDVFVKGGEVTLRGTVVDRETKMKAVDRTQGVTGVGGIKNELRVKNADILESELMPHAD